MSSLIYAALPQLRRRDIRILTILPRKPNDDQGQIICELEVANLDDKTRYHALSYTWGSPLGTEDSRRRYDNRRRDSSIVCNGQLLSVQLNLHDALSRIREKVDWLERKIWVDAVCIDQASPPERSSQVRLMADIYSCAESVMVWLGEEAEHSAKGLELIEKLALCARDDLITITPQNFSRQEGLLGRFVEQEYWEGLVCLFQRTYFARVWIIQEVVLARRIDVFCGGGLSKWGYLEAVSHFLSTSSWKRYFESDSTPTSSHSDYLGSLSGFGQSNHSLPTKLRAIKRDYQAGSYSKTLLYALIRSRVFKASDPRDKIYGLLGLVDAAVKDKVSLRPEYGDRSVADAYILASKQLLEDFDDLLILTCVEGQRYKLAGHPSLPSWVPDWTCERPLGLGVTGYERYSAAGGLPKYIRFHESPSRLELMGQRIDEISVKGESKASIVEQGFSRWLAIISSLADTYITGEDKFEVFWRTLLTNTGGDPPTYPILKKHAYGFVSWFVNILLSKHGNDYQHPEFQSSIRQLGAFSNSAQMRDFISREGQISESIARISQHSSSLYDVTAEDYGATFSHAPHLSLFRTKNGYLGVGAEPLEEGDSIWVICGSRVPLIFRNVREGNYQLIGGVYLHGFMNRELSDFHNFSFSTVYVI